MSATVPDVSEVRRRLSVAYGVSVRRGSLADAARILGMSASAFGQWLKRNDIGVWRDLQRHRGPRTDAHEILVRLLLIKSADGYRHGRKFIASGLGVTVQALSYYVARWAPDGLDAAIADLMPEDSR